MRSCNLESDNALIRAIVRPFCRWGTDKELGAKLASVVIGNPYCGVAWPLTLELNHLDIAGVDFASYANTEPWLKVLHEQKRSLVDWNAVPAVFIREPDDDDDGDYEPDFAIEDFTSDYDDDGWEGDGEEEEDEDEEGEEDAEDIPL